MEIKILGTGCAKCKVLYTNMEEVIAELGFDAKLTKEEDIMKIMEYNVMRTPAIVVDGKVLSAGNVLSKDEIKTLLTK